LTAIQTIGVAALSVGCAIFAETQERATSSVSQPAPVADHHQHLFSPALAELMSTTPPVASAKPRTAEDLIEQLDAAGIRRAVVLSTAYIFEQPSRQADGAEEKLRRENDWTSRQVARYRDRLIGFCGLNPLKDYALDELKRCATDPNLQRGLKLHFGNSVVDYHNPAHIEQVRRVFRAANEHRMTIVAHVRASVTQKLPYGRDEALIFLNELMPAAPDVVVQIAHLAGAGSWQDEGAQQALDVFADAVAKRDPRTRLLYIDVTAPGVPPAADKAQWGAAMIRRLGTERVLFGSDATLPNTTAGDAWAALRRLLPLTDDEFRAIAANAPPYMR
jgi:predicted TIM-barrel fold metal-dependent hydrolase